MTFWVATVGFFSFAMTSTCQSLSELTFFNWRQALYSTLQSSAWLDFLPIGSLTTNPRFSALSFQDGFPNRWNKGAWLLPIAAWAQGDRADLACLVEKLSTKLLHTTAWQNQPLAAYVHIESTSQAYLTFTLTDFAWAELCAHTRLVPPEPTVALVGAAPSLRPILKQLSASQAWRRAEYRLAWLYKADSRIHLPQPLSTTSLTELYTHTQARQLLAQVESLCFYYTQLIESKNSTLPPLTAKRLEGQLNNLLKDFHDFYRNTKILSGDLAKQKALLNLALAVGYALNLYNLRQTYYGSHPGSFGKIYS